MGSVLLVYVIFITSRIFWIVNLNGADCSSQAKRKVTPEHPNEDILTQIKNVGKNIYPPDHYIPQVYAEGYHPIGPPAYGPANYHRPNKYGFGMVPMHGLSDPCNKHKIPNDHRYGTQQTNVGRTKLCYGLCVGQYGFRKTGVCVPAIGCRCFSHKLDPKLWMRELMYSPTVAPGKYYRNIDKHLPEKDKKETSKLKNSST